MMPGMNPRKMKQMMKQLGMNMNQIDDVREILIITGKGRYVFDHAEVTAMTMQGVTTYQISGEPKFEPAAMEIPDADVQLVADQTGATIEAARFALVEASGDIAAAILNLSKHD